MKIKNKRILKNGAIAGYVYYTNEKKWKWRIIGNKTKNKQKGGNIPAIGDNMNGNYGNYVNPVNPDNNDNSVYASNIGNLVNNENNSNNFLNGNTDLYKQSYMFTYGNFDFKFPTNRLYSIKQFIIRLWKNYDFKVTKSILKDRFAAYHSNLPIDNHIPTIYETRFIQEYGPIHGNALEDNHEYNPLSDNAYPIILNWIAEDRKIAAEEANGARNGQLLPIPPAIIDNYNDAADEEVILAAELDDEW